MPRGRSPPTLPAPAIVAAADCHWCRVRSVEIIEHQAEAAAWELAYLTPSWAALTVGGPAVLDDPDPDDFAGTQAA
jgi:hypothetical protein